jgi:hypothetical protein
MTHKPVAEINFAAIRGHRELAASDRPPGECSIS